MTGKRKSYLYECRKCSKPEKCRIRIFGARLNPSNVPCVFANGFVQEWTRIETREEP
jgi:hypothetical protein